MGGVKRTRLRREERRLRPIVLGQLAAQRIDVFCWCNRCGHNAVVEADRLAAEMGPAFPVPEAGTRMRCSGCGSKDVATRPDWPSLGPVARH